MLSYCFFTHANCGQDKKQNRTVDLRNWLQEIMLWSWLISACFAKPNQALQLEQQLSQRTEPTLVHFVWLMLAFCFNWLKLNGREKRLQTLLFFKGRFHPFSRLLWERKTVMLGTFHMTTSRIFVFLVRICILYHTAELNVQYIVY